MSALYDELIDKIHGGKSPYEGFPVDSWGGTWYNDPGAKRIVSMDSLGRSTPGLVIEVGSFVGESAICAADQLKQRGGEFCILCVDTWMGGIDHWLKVPEKLRFHFGRPSLYYQFIGNVIKHGHQNCIVPLSLDSVNAARLLTQIGVVADMVYIDASHEEGDVMRDYNAYWPLLRPGGVFLVDDLTGWFPGVVSDFEKFYKSMDLIPEVQGEKGLLVKPE